jgi:hypothetical protein
MKDNFLENMMAIIATLPLAAAAALARVMLKPNDDLAKDVRIFIGSTLFATVAGLMTDGVSWLKPFNYGIVGLAGYAGPELLSWLIEKLRNPIQFIQQLTNLNKSKKEDNTDK